MQTQASDDETFDALIIGAGQAAKPLAIALGEAGWKTAVIDPQLGRVGLTERQAKEAGHRILVARLPMSGVARALETGESRGFMKAVVDADSGLILGCAVLGAEGGELMAMLQLAMMGDIPYTRLRDGIFAHPTLAESLNALFAAPEAAEGWKPGREAQAPMEEA